jgi:DNA-binding response OmpR family regulator
MADANLAAPYQILVSHADPGLRCLLEANLCAAGFEVLSACSGDETWVHLQTETGPMPALVVTGAFYPQGISGLELLARMRGDPSTRPIPVLLMLPAPDDAPPVWLVTRIARWDWGLLVPFNPAQLSRAIPEIARQARSPEPFLPPKFGDLRLCWQWWRDRLARYGLEYPER